MPLPIKPDLTGKDKIINDLQIKLRQARLELRRYRYAEFYQQLEATEKDPQEFNHSMRKCMEWYDQETEDMTGGG